MKNIIKKAGLLLFATLIFSACSTPEKKETIDLEKIAVEILEFKGNKISLGIAK